MKINLTILLAAIIFVSCSKSRIEINVSSLTATYTGEAKLYGPVSCLKIEGGEQVSLTATDNNTISIRYSPQGGLPGFVPFPPVQAKFKAFENSTYYFTVEPLNNDDCKVWPSDDLTDNGIRYNIAIRPGGVIEAHMGYHSYTLPQGEQYFEFKGAKN